MTAADSHPGPADIVRHEEQVHVGTTRAPYRAVRVHRRIVTETRLIEVEVRTEVLDIDWHDADPSGSTGPHSKDERLEFVLHGEEPEVRLVTVPRERVTLTRVNVAGTAEVQTDVCSERISIDRR